MTTKLLITPLVGLLLLVASFFALASETNRPESLPKENYDWVFSGSIQPKLSISQMLENFPRGSETYFVGLVECLHLKTHFEAKVSSMNKFAKDKGWPQNPERMKRLIKTVEDLDHPMETSGANYAAMGALREGEPIEDYFTYDFLMNGVQRYIDSKDLRLTSSSDRAILKQAFALEDLKACVHHEKQFEEIFDRD